MKKYVNSFFINDKLVLTENQNRSKMNKSHNKNASSGTISKYEYGYDYNHDTSSYAKKGMITSLEDADTYTTDYYYDDLYQLTKTEHPNYGDFRDSSIIDNKTYEWAYDDIGNRTSETIDSGTPTAYTYYQQGFTINSGCSMTDGTSGINSQLLKNDGTWTYTYDRQGRMCRKTDGSNTYGYAYDETDRLTEIIDDPDGTPSTIAAYKYDFNGNRYEKTVSSTTTQYLYSGNSIVREDDGTNAYLYYHGTRIDDILGQDDGTADAYYYKNHLGSVMQMKVGTTTDSYDYTAWGGMSIGGE